MKNVLLALLVMFSTLVFGQVEYEQSIDVIFSQWDKPNSPGCSVGIFKDNEIIFSKSYGLANMEYNIPNDENSVFRIASTSKQFTAACIVLLVQEGKINLNDNLKSIFPAFPSYAERITVRHLLNHTSGIRDYLQLSYLSGMGDNDFYEDEDVMKWLVNQSDLNFPPGEDYLYSNSGYWLLGQIVNKVSGMNMADYAQKEIFMPLGMMNTHFHNDHNQIVKNRASGYAPIGEDEHEIRMTKLEMIGDGGIFTTVNDLKKWDDAFYNSDKLDQSFWGMMTTKGVLNNGDEIDYASGLMINNYKGLNTVSHGGSFVGFNAEMMRFPDQKTTIVVLANTDYFGATAQAHQIADVIFSDDFKVDEEEVTEAKPPVDFISLSDTELEAFSGEYWNINDSYKRKIYVKDGSLMYYRNPYSESVLKPISKNKFKMMNVDVDLIVGFDMKNEHPMSVTIDGDEPIKFKAIENTEFTEATLEEYTGAYFCQELDVTYQINLVDGQLLLSVNDLADQVMQPVMDKLLLQGNYGAFEFEAESNGLITGFRLASGRVKNLYFEKKQ